MHRNKTPYTKNSSSTFNIINAICDTEGNPLLFAVNFNDGFTLISATKKSVPILADIEHGHYDGISSSGANILIQEYIQLLAELKNNPDAPILKEEWRQYERNKQLSIPLLSKVNNDYYDLLDDYLLIWEDQGYDVTYLNHPFEDLPDDVYDDFCCCAEDTDMPGYDYMQCAIIARKETSSYTIVGPLTTTSWHQDSPYKDPATSKLGCSTIAAGQIMKAFQYPNCYAWSSMPDALTSYNSVLCSFLATLKSIIGVDNNGGASIYQVKNAFQSYGYNCTIQNHNSINIYNHLSVNKPVYCRGKDVNTNEGHAWVCDGFYKSQTTTNFVLYTLVFDCGSPIAFEENQCYTAYNYFDPVFHINWGQGGNYNGYYHDSSLIYTRPDGIQRSYTSNERQEILLTVNNQ